MKEYRSAISIILTGLFLVLQGCLKDEYELGQLVMPVNVTLDYVIVGADAANPYGDGSGVVNFSATADHAITYNFNFGDGKDNEIAPDGGVSHGFSKNGINPYYVTVTAVGTGGLSSSKTIQIEVFSSFTDEEAVDFLSGGSVKTWYWAADQPGHLGLGPNDQVYDDGAHTFSAWYTAAAFEKSATSLYETQCVFILDGENLTFEQINSTGEAFIQGKYSEDLGLGIEGSYPWDFEGVKNVSFGPSSSIATEDGGYRGTTMSFSDGGFMGFYAGSSEYEIMEISENILKVRMVQANEPLFAWYHIFTPVKPVQ